jgi:hypothetical protein
MVNLVQPSPRQDVMILKKSSELIQVNQIIPFRVRAQVPLIFQIGAELPDDLFQYCAVFCHFIKRIATKTHK